MTHLERRAAVTPRVAVKAGRVYWQPSAALRRRGFAGTSLGPLTVDALNRADALNDQADAAIAADRPAPPTTTLAGVIAAYLASPDFAALAPRTQADRRRHLARAGRDLGDRNPAAMRARDVRAWIRTIGPGRHAYDHAPTLRACLGWAVSELDLAHNPAAGLNLSPPDSRKRIGTRDELWAIVRAADAIGRPSIAVAAILLAATMQRPADVRAWTAGDLVDGVLYVTQAKTGVELSFALHADALARLPHGVNDPAAPLVRNETTRAAYSERTFDETWAKVRATAAADMPSLVGADPAVKEPTLRGTLNAAHLRRTGMVWAAEGGALIPDICSVSGHSLKAGTKILETYLPRQRSLAERALARLDLHQRPAAI